MNLQGGRVVLREKRLGDAWNEYQWRSNPELSQLDATLPLSISYEEFLRIFKGQLEYPTPWAKRMSVDTLDGLYIGNCMYYDVDTINKEAEIGIMIGNQAYWNDGYGFEILITFIDHIFSSTTLNRLYLHTLEWNKRAKRCFEKCGFDVVKPVRRSKQDFILMELLRDAWEQVREEKLAVRDALAKPVPRGTAT